MVMVRCGKPRTCCGRVRRGIRTQTTTRERERETGDKKQYQLEMSHSNAFQVVSFFKPVYIFERQTVKDQSYITFSTGSSDFCAGSSKHICVHNYRCTIRRTVVCPYRHRCTGTVLYCTQYHQYHTTMLDIQYQVPRGLDSTYCTVAGFTFFVHMYVLVSYNARWLSRKLRDVTLWHEVRHPRTSKQHDKCHTKNALPTMTVCRRFHKLPPLTSAIFLNIWFTYVPEKTFCFVYSWGELKWWCYSCFTNVGSKSPRMNGCGAITHEDKSRSKGDGCQKFLLE
jgi:hypothetical protein